MWSILLTVLVTTSGVVAAYVVIPQVSDSSQVLRDYSLSTSPSSMTVNQGSSATTTVTVASLNGFDLATGLGATATGTGLSLSLSSTIVTPIAGGKAATVLTVSAAPSTPTGSYTIQITSSGGTRTHSATLTVDVAAADFAIATLAYPFQVAQGSANTTIVTFTGLNSFTGDVTISASTMFGALAVAGTPSTVNLTPGTSAVATLAVSALSTATIGAIYTVTVIGSSGSISHSLNTPVTVVQGGSIIGTGTEAMNMESYSFTSGTNVTIFLRNTGSASLTLVSYYVTDSNGNQYHLATWSGPSIAPNAVANTIITIGSSCASCTLSGTAFTFTSGYSYTIKVITARNNQFTFTVTR